MLLNMVCWQQLMDLCFNKGRSLRNGIDSSGHVWNMYLGVALLGGEANGNGRQLFRAGSPNDGHI